MENSENTGNWLNILIEELQMPSTAEFCRKANLNRGLVDKLTKDMHSPSLETLQKIKHTFPETNMNWLISGMGNVLEDVQDDDEKNLIRIFRTKIKNEGNPRIIDKFLVSVDYFLQDKREMEEMENNATAQGINNEDLIESRMELILFQYRRQLVADLLNKASDEASQITGSISGVNKKYLDLLDRLNNEIHKKVKLISDEFVNMPEEIHQDVVPETTHDDKMGEDEVRQWSELLDYAEKLEESNSNEKD